MSGFWPLRHNSHIFLATFWGDPHSLSVGNRSARHVFSEMSKEILIVIWTPMSLKFWHCVMYESRTLLMHHDILFIIEIGLCQFSHLVHVIVFLAYFYLFKRYLYALILCISHKFVHTYHTFIPQLVFVLILLDPFVIHEKKLE